MSTRPIATQIRQMLRGLQGSKVVDFGALAQARAASRELSKSVISGAELAGYEPDHSLYLLAQNIASVQTEILTALPVMDPFSDLIEEAERRFGAPGAPHSPLTLSFATCWAFFDAWVGPARETIGDILVDLSSVLPVRPEVAAALRLLSASRMGVFEHAGHLGGLVELHDLMTGERHSCLVPAGYPGRPGELWYARVLPPPLPMFGRHVVFTTPYVLAEPDREGWLAYLATAPSSRRASLADFLKFGPEPLFWPRFVREAFRDREADVVYLAGLPERADFGPPPIFAVRVSPSTLQAACAAPPASSPDQSSQVNEPASGASHARHPEPDPAPAQALSHSSRKGVMYYLCQVERRGKPRLVMARAVRGKPLAELPAGYEIAETPNGTVSVRLERPSRIALEESLQLERALAARPNLAGYLVERTDDALVIHEPAGISDIRDLEARFGVHAAALHEVERRYARYGPVFRFVLADEARRLFVPNRMCYRGLRDRWLPLGGAASLAELIDTCLEHLGQESFFDLV